MGDRIMGDRANVIIKQNDEQVVLYTHWDGCDLPQIVQAALIRGESRLTDFQYLTRIIFCEMIQHDIMGTTNYGITNKVHDNDRPIITIDMDDDTIHLGGSTTHIYALKYFGEVDIKALGSY